MWVASTRDRVVARHRERIGLGVANTGQIPWAEYWQKEAWARSKCEVTNRLESGLIGVASRRVAARSSWDRSSERLTFDRSTNNASVKRGPSLMSSAGKAMRAS